VGSFGANSPEDHLSGKLIERLHKGEEALHHTLLLQRGTPWMLSLQAKSRKGVGGRGWVPSVKNVYRRRLEQGRRSVRSDD